MSYTPVNLRVFLAAYSGAVSGMTASFRLQTSSNSATYTDIATIAGAFAQSFDTLYPGGTNSLELYITQEICEAVWEARTPQGLGAGFNEPATYNNISRALFAIIQASVSYFAAQGIPTNAPTDDDQVAVSGNDTTPGFLIQKLAATGGITFNILNAGGNEQLQIDGSGITPDSFKVAASTSDTTPGFLFSKLDSTGGIVLTLQNPGANENVLIDPSILITALTNAFQAYIDARTLTFSDATLLAAFDATNTPDFTEASVGTIFDTYRLVKVPTANVTAAVDSSNVIAASAPAGAVWVRVYDYNIPASYVPAWFIDAASGNDANPGISALSPLKTLAELGRRLNGTTINQSVTVTLGSGSYGNLFLDLFIPQAGSGRDFVINGNVTEAAPIAITANTAQVPSTATRGSISIAAGVFTLYDRLVLKTGAQIGARAFVTKVTGTTANVARWMQLPATATSRDITLVNPANGDTFAQETLNTTISTVNVRVRGGGRVTIKNCKVVANASGTFHQTNNDFSDINSGVFFQLCDFSGLPGFWGFQTSQFEAAICTYQDSPLFEQCQAEWQGCMIKASPFIVGRQSACSMSQGMVWVGNATLTVTQNALLQVFNIGTTTGDVSFFDSSSGANRIICRNGGYLDINTSNTRLWGVTTATQSTFLVDNNSWVSYITQPTITGGTNDTRIGGTNKTYATTPYIETLKNCGFILGTV